MPIDTITTPFPDTFVDAPTGQTLKWGSLPPVLITAPGGASSITLILEKVTFPQKYKKLASENEVGVTNKQAWMRQAREGTATFQIAKATTGAGSDGPSPGWTFLVPRHGEYPGTLQAVITSDPIEYDQNAITKITVDICEVLNP